MNVGHKRKSNTIKLFQYPYVLSLTNFLTFLFNTLLYNIFSFLITIMSHITVAILLVILFNIFHLVARAIILHTKHIRISNFYVPLNTSLN